MKKTAIQKESLTKAKILKGIELIINKNTVLPILEDVFLSDNFISATDLENHVTVPFAMNGLNDAGTCVNADKFMAAIEMIDEPKFNYTQLKNKREDGNLEIYGQNKKIKLNTESQDNFPKSPIDCGKDFNEIGFFSENDLTSFKNALRFVSNDDLRPALTGIFVKNEIVATDAHRLYWHKTQPLFDKGEMIMPQKTIRLMLHFGGNWQVFGREIEENKNEKKDKKDKRKQYQKVALLNEDGVLIQFRTIDARYPDYKVVIPKDEPKAILISDTSLWRKELKNASKFCNVSTKQGTININGSISLSAYDVDFETEYHREFKATECESKGEKMRIAFNMGLLDDVLSTLPNDEPLKMNLFGPTKAAIINEHYLLMPLMLNE